LSGADGAISVVGMEALARFTVELRRPQDGWGQLQQTTARARKAARELQAQGTPIRFLRSVFVPEDDSCFLLFEAPSPDAVRAAVRRADLSAGPELRAIRAEP
jgi:muconolactone delta-isomerase